jgi:hypothetical protein
MRRAGTVTLWLYASPAREKLWYIKIRGLPAEIARATVNRPNEYISPSAALFMELDFSASTYGVAAVAMLPETSSPLSPKIRSPVVLEFRYTTMAFETPFIVAEILPLALTE